MKNKLIYLLCLLILINGFWCAKVFADDLSVTFSASNYNHSNIITADDGTKFWLNGDVSLSFNAEKSGKAIMKISLLALESGKQGLVFFNQTEAGERVYADNAPAAKDAVGGGAINIPTFTAINLVSKESFKDYIFYVDVKQGINTIFIPNGNFTNDCDKLVYEIASGVGGNNKVCYKSISIEGCNDLSYKIYPDDVSSNNLTYHPDGQIVEGYDKLDALTNHTVRQEYESMFTVIPFYVENEGDYIVNIRYNAYAQTTLKEKIPAAVYLDADLTGLNNAKWQDFLDTDTYTAEKIKEATDEQIRVITKNNTIEPVDLGGWMTSLYDENQKSAPFYHLKSFKLGNLAKGEHTLLFYTAKDILQSTDKVVNKDVYFNSFEFEFLTPEYEKIETFCVPVVNMQTTSGNKALIPQFYDDAKKDLALSENEWKNTLYIPVTVANNTKESINGMVAVVFYKDKELKTVDTHSFNLLPYQSFEEVLDASFAGIDANTFKVFIWNKESIMPYESPSIVLGENEVEEITALKIEAEDAEYATTNATTHQNTSVNAGYAQTKGNGAKVVGGGNIVFRFNSPQAQEVTLKIVYYMGSATTDWRLGFFNPVATPSSYNLNMQAGVDYPELSGAVFVDSSWKNANNTEYTFSAKVTAKKGENVVWIPGRNLLCANANNTATLNMYEDSKGKRPNVQTQLDYIEITPTVKNVTKTE